jgi:hypothetical protein
MSTDFFIGFWSGALAIILVEFALIWSVDETEDDDDDDYHYEPFDDDHNHFQPA